MKLINLAPAAATLELDPRDCLALADAVGHALAHDVAGDWHLLQALRAALTAAALATFTLDAGAVAEHEHTLAALRDVWAPEDGHHTDGRKAPAPA